MITPETNIAMHSGREVNIGLVKYSAVKTGKPGWRKMYQQRNNNHAKFPQLSQEEEKKNYAAYMKSVDKFIHS